MAAYIFVTALGLFLVFEGILPFLSPRIWRWVLQQIFIQSDQAVRLTGLFSMLMGLGLVTLARHVF